MADPTVPVVGDQDTSGATRPGELHINVGGSRGLVAPEPAAAGGGAAPAPPNVAPPVVSGEADQFAEAGATEPTNAPAVTTADPFADAGATEPSSPGGKAGAIAEGAAHGFIGGAGLTAGAIAGGELGLLGGPAAPVTVPVGALLGLFAGYYAANKVNSFAGLRSPEEMPADMRPYGYAGEVAGGSMAGAGGVMSLGRIGVSSSVPFVQKIISYAQDNPFKFLAAETAAGGSAGFAEGGTEMVRPGDAKMRIASGLAAGMLNPATYAQAGVRKAGSMVRYFLKFSSADGQQNLAIKRLNEIMKYHSEDPVALEAVLAQPDLVPGMTTAQKSGSPAMAALEQHLMATHRSFGARVATQASQALTAMKNLVGLTAHYGNPAELTAHAVAREQYFKTLIDGSVQKAIAEAVAEAGKITTDTPETRAELGRIASEAVKKALIMARDAEHELWEKVPEDIPGHPYGVLSAYLKVRADLMTKDGERLPDLVENYVRRMAAKDRKNPLGDPFAPVGPETPPDLENWDLSIGADAPMPGAAPKTTSGELIKMRSRMLALARKARAQNEFDDARQYEAIGAGALADLSRLGESVHNTAFDDAREFTFQLYQTFQRTFAGSATAVSRTGAARVEPEELLERAFGGGGVSADLDLRQLQDATEFLQNQGIANTPASAQNIKDMADAQRRLVRLAAANSIDPSTGQVSVPRLSKFMADYKGILDRFPEIRTDIENALTSQRNAEAFVKGYAGTPRIVEQRRILGKLIGTDAPVDAVAKVLNGPEPLKDFTRMAELVHGTPDAEAGLRTSVLEQAINKATTGDVLDFGKLDELLNKPWRPGLPSLSQMLRGSGLLSTAENARLTQLLAAGQKAEGTEALAKAGPGLPAPEKVGEAVSMFARMFGARAGGATAKFVLGESSLIANMAGSKFVLGLMEKMVGTQSATAILERAIEDPQFMAHLLRSPSTPMEVFHWGKRMHAYMLGMGMDTKGAEADVTDDPFSAAGATPAGSSASPAAAPAASSPAPVAKEPSPALAPVAPSPLPLQGHPEALQRISAGPKGPNAVGYAMLPLIRSLERSADNAISKPANPALEPAGGRYQIQPGTAATHGIKIDMQGLMNVQHNTDIAAHILTNLYHQFHGDVEAVLVAYNAGPGVAQKWLAAGKDVKVLPPETRAYIAHAEKIGLR